MSTETIYDRSEFKRIQKMTDDERNKLDKIKLEIYYPTNSEIQYKNAFRKFVCTAVVNDVLRIKLKNFNEDSYTSIATQHKLTERPVGVIFSVKCPVQFTIEKNRKNGGEYLRMKIAITSNKFIEHNFSNVEARYIKSIPELINKFIDPHDKIKVDLINSEQ